MTIWVVNTLILLSLYFCLASLALAMVLFPAARFWAAARGRGGLKVVRGLGLKSWAVNHGVARTSGRLARHSLASLYCWIRKNIRRVLIAVFVLFIVPVMAVGLRTIYRVDSFDHTFARPVDPHIAALLAGERLVAPPVIPPDVFVSMLSSDVERARPLVRFASREWALLDADFRQRLLLIYQTMRQKHGYDMVLIEGYRSPQRQAQLMDLGGHVTQAGAYMSYHQYGLAADSAFLRNGKIVISEQDPWAMRGYELFGEVAKEFGLSWGGGWRRLKDYGHVELKVQGVLGSSISENNQGATDAHY